MQEASRTWAAVGAAGRERKVTGTPAPSSLNFDTCPVLYSLELPIQSAAIILMSVSILHRNKWSIREQNFPEHSASHSYLWDCRELQNNTLKVTILSVTRTNKTLLKVTKTNKTRTSAVITLWVSVTKCLALYKKPSRPLASKVYIEFSSCTKLHWKKVDWRKIAMTLTIVPKVCWDSSEIEESLL